MITLDQAFDLALLITLSVVASGACVLVFGPHRWSAMLRPVLASLLLGVGLPILAVEIFGMRWNTMVLALAVVVISFIAVYTHDSPSPSLDDHWP